MTFRITGLSAEPFHHLFGLDDHELARNGVKRYVADRPSAFPCRVEMRDGLPGETFLLANYEHQPARTPYRATHAIFVREGAKDTYDAVDQVPDVMRSRLLSIRAFDETGMMLDADVVEGREIEGLIERLFSNQAVDYLHAHYARRGCFSGRIGRVG